MIERATTLGKELGRVVVVLVGYNDYENRYALNIEKALAAFREAGVERVLWATLRAERQCVPDDERGDPRGCGALAGDDGARLERALARPSRLDPGGRHPPDRARRAGDGAMVSDELTRLGVAPRVASTVSIAATALPVAPSTARSRPASRPRAGRRRTVGRSCAAASRAALRLTTDGRLRGIPARAGVYHPRLRVVDRTGASGTRVVTVRVAA